MPHAPCPLPSAPNAPAGILLAGGQSSRMGQEKGLVEFRGQPLIQYGIDLLSAYSCKLLISTSNPAYRSFGFELVADEIGSSGPAAGIAAALKKSPSAWNIVLACDLPFLEMELIDQLLSAKEDYQAVVPVHQGKIEPLSALYHRDLAEHFDASLANGTRALYKILQSCPVCYLETDGLLLKYPHLFANFNALDELKSFL